MAKKEKAKIPEPISNAFLDSYLETCLWSSTDESNEQGGDPLDQNYSVEDFSDEALAKAVKDCNAFIKRAEKLMDEAVEIKKRAGKVIPDDNQHGHDFWLTRNRHGAGFWDRGYGAVGDKLTEIAQSFGEQYAIVGDDGKIHLEGGR